MTGYKCVRCGKQMEIALGATTGKCGFCGTKQALPMIRDEDMAKRYDTANGYFIENEYVKAEGNYEPLAKECPKDPFPKWMLLLCRYGIQYCKDKESSEWKPTIRRFQERMVKSDRHYIDAQNLADTEQLTLFEREAEELEKVRKHVQEVSEKEMPVDVFISFKNKDEKDMLTEDHTWAETLYYDLKRQGARVFYAPVSLHGKVGEYYEPYIYAAIHSAKVMIVLGTKPEYFTSPWIRNEWDRFLDLKKNSDDTKLLMTVYKNMSTSDLPKELTTSLQTIEMTGEWLQTVEDKVSQALSATGMELPRILKRGFEFLKDGDPKKADVQFEKTLDTDSLSKNAYAMAYVGKLMIALNVKSLQELSFQEEPFDDQSYYKKAKDAGSSITKEMLEDYTRRIKEKKEYKRQLAIYNEGKAMMEAATTEEGYRKAAEKFAEIPGFQNASELHSTCIENAEKCRKEVIYQSAIEWMKQNTIKGYTEAIKIFNGIPEWRDSLAQAENCREAIEKVKADTYEKGKKLLMEANTQKDYERAASHFETIKDHKEASFYADLSHKFGREACGNAALVDMLEKACKGDLEGFDDARSCYKSFAKGIGAENLAMLRKLAEEQQRKAWMKERFGEVKIGSVIPFGRYCQDSQATEKTPIDWIVLDKEPDGTLLLISKYGLDCQPYNTEKKEVTWETCSLRRWLNGVFYEAAFNGEEKGMILDTKLANKDNPKYGTKGGNPTTDRVFLLSLEEAEKYFGSDGERMCFPAEHAVKQGAYVDNERKTCWWWLRSPGDESSVAAYVYDDGSLSFIGVWVDHSSNAVRPSLRLHL